MQQLNTHQMMHRQEVAVGFQYLHFLTRGGSMVAGRVRVIFLDCLLGRHLPSRWLVVVDLYIPQPPEV